MLPTTSKSVATCNGRVSDVGLVGRVYAIKVRLGSFAFEFIKSPDV